MANKILFEGSNEEFAFRNYAKEAGISFIILCSGVKRTNAHAFYEHNGYDKDSYCVDKNITPA